MATDTAVLKRCYSCAFLSEATTGPNCGPCRNADRGRPHQTYVNWKPRPAEDIPVKAERVVCPKCDQSWTEDGHVHECPADRLDSRATDPVKSDGGSSTYYFLPKGATELNDLIEYKQMSFARGNIFKALYRLGNKAGTDVEYDLNKIELFLGRLREMHRKGIPL